MSVDLPAAPRPDRRRVLRLLLGAGALGAVAGAQPLPPAAADGAGQSDPSAREVLDGGTP